MVPPLPAAVGLSPLPAPCASLPAFPTPTWCVFSFPASTWFSSSPMPLFPATSYDPSTSPTLPAAPTGLRSQLPPTGLRSQLPLIGRFSQLPPHGFRVCLRSQLPLTRFRSRLSPSPPPPPPPVPPPPPTLLCLGSWRDESFQSTPQMVWRRSMVPPAGLGSVLLIVCLRLSKPVGLFSRLSPASTVSTFRPENTNTLLKIPPILIYFKSLQMFHGNAN